MTEPERIIAQDRAEDDYCERGTQGCSINHTAELQLGATANSGCETW